MLHGSKGNVDLVCLFLAAKASRLLGERVSLASLRRTRYAEGDTRELSLEQLLVGTAPMIRAIRTPKVAWHSNSSSCATLVFPTSVEWRAASRKKVRAAKSPSYLKAKKWRHFTIHCRLVLKDRNHLSFTGTTRSMGGVCAIARMTFAQKLLRSTERMKERMFFSLP